ncbi:hypothetical protein B0H13DRAFT_1868922 [Mycena leptocephala]|nr:hypothetical protein B0H13DRAFT_1868922 [Mycena leptocephala]
MDEVGDSASREKGKGEGNSEQTEMLQVVPENQNKWEEPVVQVTEPSGPRKIAIELASNEWSVKLGRARNPQQWAVMAERRTIHECANHRGERRQRLRATGEVEGAKTKTKEYIYPMQVPLAQMVEYGNGGQPGEAWRKRMRNDSEGKHGTCGLQSGFVDEETRSKDDDRVKKNSASPGHAMRKAVSYRASPRYGSMTLVRCRN